MSKEMDDIFDDDLELLNDSGVDDGLQDNPKPIEDSIFNEDDLFNDSPKTDEGLIFDLLKINGIKDGKIKVVNEDGNEEIVDFFSLEKEEQLEILKPQEIIKSDLVGLSEDEAKFINNLRTGNLSINEYLNKYKEDVLSEVVIPEESYDIDSYDDQELFLLDLKAKFDLTDEELEKELEKELQNEDIFKKKVSKLRDEYKQLEDNYKKEQQDNFNKKQTDEYNQFVNKMVDVAIKSPDLYGIELEDSEKNEVLSFLLDLDDNGVSDFYKNLQSPEKLYEAAWFLRYGKDAMEAIKNTYEEEINKLKKDKTQVVVRQKDNKIRSIHEI
jgi:hypothetical protein